MKLCVFSRKLLVGWMAVAALASGLAQAQVKPGATSKVTLALSVSTQQPGLFQRDEDGQFVLDGSGARIPAIFNFWSIYDESRMTMTQNGEWNSKVVKKRYSNREFLTDLVSKGIISGPIQGWSIENVIAEVYDEEDGAYLGSVASFFAVKNGVTPVELPPEVIWFGDRILLENSSGKGTMRFSNVTDPDPESDDWENWEYVSGSQSSGKTFWKRLLQVESDIGEPELVALPAGFDKDDYLSWNEDVEDVTAEQAIRFRLQGVTTSSDGKVKRFKSGGETYWVWTPPATKITAITGAGPSIFIREHYEGGGDYAWEWISSIVEGRITLGAGSAKDVQAYPGLILEDESGDE